MGENTAIVVALICAVGSGCVGNSSAQRTTTRSPPTATHEAASSQPATSVPEHCAPKQHPVEALPATPQAEGSCQPFLRAKLTATETKLRKSYKPIYGDSRVIVDFSCDPVEQIGQIDLERGDGRNRTLTFLRFTRPPEGGAYHVVGVEIREPDATPGNDAQPNGALEVKAVALDLAATALDVQDVRTPLTATINEVRFADRLPSVDGFTGPEIRRLVRLEGRYQHFIERSYTGFAESTTQKDYLPIDLASAPLLALVPSDAFEATITEEHRQLFSSRFAATFSTAPEWLRTLLLEASERLGVITDSDPPCALPEHSRLDSRPRAGATAS